MRGIAGAQRQPGCCFLENNQPRPMLDLALSICVTGTIITAFASVVFAAVSRPR